ncbi:MAG: peptidoglycan DD-metalloendopeptidase family protein [Gammaproteobacteria bacterium]|nr:peptidoglycan DD-metalloendopeptidase family protein [Gammaproteobacteria bacterium]
MNIIVISEGIRKGTIASFSHRQFLAIAFVGGLLLPALLGTVIFHIHDLITRNADPEDQIVAYSKELSKQSRALDAAKREASTHLNALARRMGQLQAQVLRLNALGGRLTRMAGLDNREFNFESEVGQGGPETTTIAGKSEVSISLDRLAADIRTSEARLRALETLLLDRRLSDAVTPAGWPAEGGFVSSAFGQRADPFTGQIAYHEGVDIASKLGSSVRAMADGVVVYAGERSGYGNVVEITHGDGLITRYAHAMTVLVKVGDKVQRGMPIARVGSSGRSTGPHIHLEVLKNGRAVNPAQYLRPSAFPPSAHS